MKAEALVFVEPRCVAVESLLLPSLQPGQALVRTLCSAISAGTELLIYRGEAPLGIPIDPTLPALSGQLAYPLRYGYSSVGVVEDVADNVDAALRGSTVFAFQPHATHFIAAADALILIPDSVDIAQAAMLPALETALTIVMDAAPRIGERCAVFGQGVVGLLITSLLARFPLADLVAVDPLPDRLDHARRRGAHRALSSDAAADLADMDLAIEMSGNPRALDGAIHACGFDGRVIVGSWYGTRRADVDLGAHFHRSRIQLSSSQVSTLAPGVTGRWTRARRIGEVLRLMPELDLGALITHRFALADAAQAYALLDEGAEPALQVLFDYTTVDG